MEDVFNKLERPSFSQYVGGSLAEISSYSDWEPVSVVSILTWSLSSLLNT